MATEYRIDGVPFFAETEEEIENAFREFLKNEFLKGVPDVYMCEKNRLHVRRIFVSRQDKMQMIFSNDEFRLREMNFYTGSARMINLESVTEPEKKIEMINSLLRRYREFCIQNCLDIAFKMEHWHITAEHVANLVLFKGVNNLKDVLDAILYEYERPVKKAHKPPRDTVVLSEDAYRQLLVASLKKQDSQLKPFWLVVGLALAFLVLKAVFKW